MGEMSQARLRNRLLLTDSIFFSIYGKLTLPFYFFSGIFNLLVKKFYRFIIVFISEFQGIRSHLNNNNQLHRPYRVSHNHQRHHM